nr:alpha/beta hydrolase [Sphingomonas sp. Y57]
MTIWTDLLETEVRFVTANGIRTRVVEAGTGPALLLLHGSGGHVEAYSRNIRPLAAAGYHVVAMDYLGSGLTDYPPHLPDLADRVGHIVGVLDAMEIERATLIGESFGGTLAFAVAKQHPDRVSALIPVVGGAFEVGNFDDPEGQWRRSMAAIVQRQRAFLAKPSREAVRDRLAWLFHRPDRDITEELVDTRWHFYQREACRRAIFDLSAMIEDDVDYRFGARAGMKRQDALRPMTAECLAEVAHPTLFVWTDHNPSTPAATARSAADHVPDSEFVVMDDCGHWPQWEKPELFNTLIVDFLRRRLGGRDEARQHGEG